MSVMEKDYVVCPLIGRSLSKGGALAPFIKCRRNAGKYLWTFLPSGGTTLFVCGTGDSHADYKIIVFFASR